MSDTSTQVRTRWWFRFDRDLPNALRGEHVETSIWIDGMAPSQKDVQRARRRAGGGLVVEMERKDIRWT